MDQRFEKNTLVERVVVGGILGMIGPHKTRQREQVESVAEEQSHTQPIKKILNLSFGKYTLVERIGCGGMAEVFKARLAGPGGFEKYLAVKTILPRTSEDQEFLKLFVKEARLSALLDHANIVRVHEFDRAGDRYYIAMEYVDGRDLLAVINRCRELYRPLRVPEVLLIGLEICRGLAYAHGELTPGGNVVLHRDISPHNVLLSKAGEVKITDFGIAKLLNGFHYNNTGKVMGKYTYMSPEQANCEELDSRTDIFSTGCVLWELLTCQKLFETGEDIPVLDETLEIKPPSTFNKDVPEELDRLVVAALDRDREKRTCSATELGRGLEEVLSTYPGVCRATDLSGLYGHLFGGDEGIQEPDTCRRDGKTLDRAPLAETKTSLSIGAAQRIKEPPTIANISCRAPEDLLAMVPRDITSKMPEIRLSCLARRWRSAAVLLAILVPVFISAALHTPHNERQGLLPSVAAGGIGVHEASTGLETNDFKASEAIGSLLDGLRVGEGTPEVPQAESVSLRGNWMPIKRNGEGYGWLSINAIPWADVYWNGELLGETPLEMVKMPVGKHSLVLVNNCVGDNKTVDVEIKKGRVTKVVVDILK